MSGIAIEGAVWGDGVTTAGAVTIDDLIVESHDPRSSGRGVGITPAYLRLLSRNSGPLPFGDPRVKTTRASESPLLQVLAQGFASGGVCDYIFRCRLDELVAVAPVPVILQEVIALLACRCCLHMLKLIQYKSYAQQRMSPIPMPCG